ncbi:MAG: competence/damage-inducible protein A, partial [Pseudobdellovibrionaceae bacterium]
GTKMIDNPVSGAPGFHIGNVYVMAGVPKIMEAMLDNIIPTLKGGAKIHSVEISAALPESKLADDLRAIQAAHTGVDIGSYPHMKDGQLGVSVVVRGEDEDAIAACAAEVKAAIAKLKI